MSEPQTTELNAVAPTVEFAALPTVPIPRVDALCAYCEIRLSAIPDPPKPVFGKDGRVVHVHYCCAGPYRHRESGLAADVERLVSRTPGTSDPR